MAAAVLTIQLSNGKPGLDGKAVQQPSSLLAIISSEFSFALGALLSMGVAVAWWRGALHWTALSRLHLIWEHGSGRGILSALTAGLDSRKVVAIALIVSAARFARAPLLRRASTLGSHDFTQDIPISIDIPQQISPETGWAQGHSTRFLDDNRPETWSSALVTIQS